MKDTTLAFNRELAQELGISAALLYQELQRKQFYWREQGRLNEEGMFWCDQKAIGDWILLHPNNVSKAAKVLEDAGLIVKKVGYRPGTTITTTWWKAVIPGINETVIPRNQRNSDSYIKATTKAVTEKESPNRDSETRMLPSALYSKLRTAFPGSSNDMRKKKIEAVEKLQTEFELSDETILDGVSEIAKHPTYKFKDGTEFTETLASLLLGDLEKTAEKLVKKAEAGKVKEEKQKKKVSRSQAMLNAGVC